MAVITLKDGTEFNPKQVSRRSSFHALGSSRGSTLDLPPPPQRKFEPDLYQEDTLLLVFQDGRPPIDLTGVEARRVWDELAKAGVYVDRHPPIVK
jgi:hypothetical protein